jgi:glycosyltransferase involved in cell wall biosynthesis
MRKICFYARAKESWHLDLLDYYTNDIKIFKELGYEVIKSYNPKMIPKDCDLYFVWWWSSGIIPLIKAKLWKKPVIMIGNIHYEDNSMQGYKNRPFYIKAFIKFCLRFSDIQIATSDIELKGIKILNARNPKMIYHCIDSQKYTYSPYSGRKNFIFTLTQLTKVNIERKKVREIIIAFKKVIEIYNGFKLVIAGNKSDDGYSDLYSFVEKLELINDVVFIGRVSDEEKVRMFKECKIYIQPTSYEGFGMAIAESMSCGAPVITSNNGAVYEVAGEEAIYVNPDNSEDIKNKILSLLSNEPLCENLSKRGADRIKSLFSYEERKKEINKLLSEIINNK